MTPPPPTRDEIRNLLGIAQRSLADAAVGGVSPDGRFELSYAAALAAATAALRSEGERIHGSDHQRLTFDALRGVAAGRWSETARSCSTAEDVATRPCTTDPGSSPPAKPKSSAAPPSSSSLTSSAGFAKHIPIWPRRRMRARALSSASALLRRTW